jgi:hypothetical protein
MFQAVRDLVTTVSNRSPRQQRRRQKTNRGIAEGEGNLVKKGEGVCYGKPLQVEECDRITVDYARNAGTVKTHHQRGHDGKVDHKLRDSMNSSVFRQLYCCYLDICGVLCWESYLDYDRPSKLAVGCHPRVYSAGVSRKGSL